MKKENRIKNVQELHLEIARLKALSREQEGYLKDQYTLLKNKVEAPARFFNHLVSFVPGASVVKNILSVTKNSNSGGKNQNIFSKVLRIGTSAAIDRLFLRKAGVLKRLIVGFMSQQAVDLINKNVSDNLIQKLSNWIRPTSKGAKSNSAEKEDLSMHFGIPPDSETY